MNQTHRDIADIVAKRALFEPLAGATVLVTGATGLIGSMMVKTLLAADELYDLQLKVIGQIRNQKKAESIIGELYQKVVWADSDNHPCDFIVHTISPTTSKYFVEHPVETIQTSVGTAMSALGAARKYNASMVYLSSMEQYGVPYVSGERMTEDKVGVIDHLSVRSSYSESKRLCECMCAAYASEYGVDVKIARLAQTFGAGIPLLDNRMPMQFARSVVKGEDIILHTEGKSLSNFVYLTDALTGILTILEKGEAGQAYNICNDGETRSVREIAEMVATEVASGKIRVRIEPKDNMGYAPDTAMYLDSGKLQALGWKSEIAMAEAYRRMVSYLANG